MSKLKTTFFCQNCGAQYAKWHNDAIKEISCIRHCITHNNGMIDQDYVDNSPLRTYQLNDVIEINEPDINTFISHFESAYRLILGI